LARRLFGLADDAEVEFLAYEDIDQGSYRFAAFCDERPLGVLYVAREPVAASRAWVCQQFDAGDKERTARQLLLAGRPGQGVADPGPIVCSCYAVGRNQILRVIGDGACSLEGVAEATNAGSNCGSCRAEIQGLIDHVTVEAAE